MGERPPFFKLVEAAEIELVGRDPQAVTGRAFVSSRSLPTSFRSCETYTWSAFRAVSGGASSQSASISRSE
ncbi:MAG: hypothetical protein M3161_00990, partial [Actinomycetota bacterium]|nr:hypothetical protein [Actinomycetota bacterium]